MSSQADPADPGVHPGDEPSQAIHHRWWGLAIKALAALVIVAVGAWFWSAILEPHEAALERTLQHLGPWGPVIFIAIFVIGIVGLVLEFALIKLATAFTFEEVKS